MLTKTLRKTTSKHRRRQINQKSELKTIKHNTHTWTYPAAVCIIEKPSSCPFFAIRDFIPLLRLVRFRPLRLVVLTPEKVGLSCKTTNGPLIIRLLHILVGCQTDPATSTTSTKNFQLWKTLDRCESPIPSLRLISLYLSRCHLFFTTTMYCTQEKLNDTYTQNKRIIGGTRKGRYTCGFHPTVAVVTVVFTLKTFPVSLSSTSPYIRTNPTLDAVDPPVVTR